MATKKSQSTSITDLKAENKRLINENKKLKKDVNTHKKASRHIWHKVVTIMLVVLAGAVLVAGNLLFWAGNTLIDNNKYVATVAPLIKNSDIQQAIASSTTDKLFSNVNVEQYVQEVLPPRAEPLAATISGQVKEYTQKSLDKLLASEQFQEVWINTMSKSHERLINFIKNYQGNGTINLQDIYNNLSSKLKSTKLSFLADKPLPQNIGSIEIINASWLPKAHNIVNNIGLYQTLATLFVIAASTLAIWLSSNKRKMVITLGVTFAVLMFLSLVSIRLANIALVNHAAQQYQAAAATAAGIITRPLIIATRTILLVSLLIILGAWISGSYHSAEAARQKFHLLLEGRAHKALFSKGENNFTIWISKHKGRLQWTTVGVVALIMMVVTLSPFLVVAYALLIATLISLIEILSA